MNRMPSVPELDCVDVREARLAGRPLSDAEAAHAASCPLCALSESPGATGPGPDLFATLEATLREETGPVAWLRARPTRVRLLAAVAAAAVLATGTALTRPRWLFAPMPVDRVTLVLSVLGVLVALLLRLALRPLQAAPPSPGAVRVAAAAGLLVPVVFALTPPDPVAASLAAPGMLAATLSCFLFGALPGVLLVLVLRALDRNALRSSDAALIAAASGGLSGNAALELHCPSTAPLHLVLGHATVGAALVLAVLAVRSFARRAA